MIGQKTFLTSTAKAFATFSKLLVIANYDYLTRT